ncbi:aldehyde dehydrogenase PuuC, partial [Chromohalobacter beijerinckii]|nr:aldehyde dehydrogenase PuuC [Chromohalobacter beijerinckii]
MAAHDLSFWHDLRNRLIMPDGAFIDGQHVQASEGATLGTWNPATGEELTKVAACGAEDVNRAVAAARR